MRSFRTFLVASAFLIGVAPTMAQDAIRWYTVDSQKQVTIHLYVFHSERCSHCQAALRFLPQLETKYPWLAVHRFETYSHPENNQKYQEMANAIGRVAGQVPAFFFCKQLEIGFTSEEVNGRRLEAGLVRCREALQKQMRSAQAPTSVFPILLMFDETQDPDLTLPEPEDRVELPLWGSVEAADVSLPLLTLVIAGFDAFNPCAFFVLLFLLSLLVRTHSRWRMLAVGGLFVFASAAVYFVFMAAWLNLFLVIGHLTAITLAAGMVAVLIAVINIKDFFYFKQGVSLSIPDSARPGLFQRMTRLVGESRWYAMLGGTIFLAITTNFYELLCTSGFPMVYTRVLTLRNLSPASHYAYLVLYNIVYVLPMAFIVIAFIRMLGVRKLTEYEGRVLKLLSGVMMLVLGGLLVVAPDFLTSLWAAAAMLVAAVTVTAIVVVIDRARHPMTPLPSPQPPL